MAIQAPNEKPGDPAAAAVRVVLCIQSSAAAASRSSPWPWSKLALRAADAAEIEAQHREAAAREHVEQVVDDPVVHRPAVQRMRMQDQRQRRRRPRAVDVAPSRRPSAPLKITSGIVLSLREPFAVGNPHAASHAGPAPCRPHALRHRVDPNPQPLIFESQR